MGDKRLTTHVEVDGTWYGPDDDVPPNIAEKITNPKVWTTAEEQAAEEKETARQVGTRSGARLNTYVDVEGTMYGPDDHIPDQVAEKITNPKVWKDGKAPDAGQPAADGSGGADPADPDGSGTGPRTDPVTPDGDDGEQPAPPGRRGMGRRAAGP